MSKHAWIAFAFLSVSLWVTAIWLPRAIDGLRPGPAYFAIRGATGYRASPAPSPESPEPSFEQQQQDQQRRPHLPIDPSSWTKAPAVDVKRHLVVRSGSHSLIGDPDAGVKGSVGIAVVVLNIDDEAYRLFRSIEIFEAKATVFVMCTKVVAYLLPRLFPSLRFMLIRQLDNYETYNGKEMINYNEQMDHIVRTAVSADVSMTWYLDTSIVLLSPLPELPAYAEVGIGSGKQQGVVAFRTAAALDRYLEGKAQDPTLELLSREEGVHAFDYGVSFPWVEATSEGDSSPIARASCSEGTLKVDDRTIYSLSFSSKNSGIAAELKNMLASCSHKSLPAYHWAEFEPNSGQRRALRQGPYSSNNIDNNNNNDDSNSNSNNNNNNSNEQTTATLLDAQHERERGMELRANAAGRSEDELRSSKKEEEEEEEEEEQQQQQARDLADHTSIAKNSMSGRLLATDYATAKGPWWYDAHKQDVEGRVVVHNHQLIPLQDEEANVVGKTVLCMVFDSLGSEVTRYLHALQIFEDSIAVFVSTTEEVVDKLLHAFPGIRFVFAAALDRFRDPETGTWLGRAKLAERNLWFDFNAERPRLIKFALESGAKNAWYTDTDIVLVQPFPVLNSSVQVGLAHHRISQGMENGYGRYNSGMAYFASVSGVERWLGFNHSRLKSVAQIVLDNFRHKPGVYEMDCGIDTGWYEMDPGLNAQKKPLWHLVQCKDGQIVFNDCPVSSFHFHYNSNGNKMMPYFLDALEACQDPALGVWHKSNTFKEVKREMEYKPELSYWNMTFDVVEPVARVAGHVVICLMADGIGSELAHVLETLQRFETHTAVFISGTKELSSRLPLMYPSMRLRIFPRLDGHQAKTGLEAVVTFHKEKAWILRAALSSGARGAWFLDAKKVPQAQLPRIPGNVQASILDRDMSVPTTLNERGNAYFTAIPDVERWLRRVAAARITAPMSNFTAAALKDMPPFSKIRAICHADT